MYGTSVSSGNSSNWVDVVCMYDMCMYVCMNGGGRAGHPTRFMYGIGISSVSIGSSNWVHISVYVYVRIAAGLGVFALYACASSLILKVR